MKHEVIVFTTGKTYCLKSFEKRETAEDFYNRIVEQYTKNKPEHNCVALMGSDGYNVHGRTIRGKNSLTKVRKHKGVYKVFFVQVPLEYPFYCELRYSKLVDAKDCAMRMGGHPYCVEFESEDDAQAYLDEAEGVVWW